MKYLIIGGCGFIGNNFAEQLLQRGDEVTLLDNLSRKGTVSNLLYLQQKYPSVKFVHGDIRADTKILSQLMETVDVVFHLAGQVAVTTSVINPKDDFETNAIGSFNVLEAIRQSERKPIIIYASTNKVYGGMSDIEIVKEGSRYIYKDFPNGISEERLLDFHSPYGCSKGAGDQYVRDYARIYGLQTVVMRQSCIYGRRQFGIEDQGWVAWFSIAAYLGKPIKIYGDGMQVRDILYVNDLFDAWDAAVRNIDRASGEVFNVGGGADFTLSLLELISYLGSIINREIPLEYAEWRPGDQPVYISNISKIKRVLGWEPYTAPQEGVRTLVNWVAENIYLLEAILKK